MKAITLPRLPHWAGVQGAVCLQAVFFAVTANTLANTSAMLIMPAYDVSKVSFQRCPCSCLLAARHLPYKRYAIFRQESLLLHPLPPLRSLFSWKLIRFLHACTTNSQQESLCVSLCESLVTG